MKFNLLHKLHHNEKIYTVSISPTFFLAGGTGRQLYRYNISPNFELSPVKIECTHNKSIRSTTISDNWYGCASYDGTATIYNDNCYFDTVEGPETEIKALSFSENKEYLALSTRGKTTWICRITTDIEVDAVLEDHTQDIKGVKWLNDTLYSYGYDNTIKFYKAMVDLEDEWVLLQSINRNSTIWDIVFLDNKTMIVAEDTGLVSIYSFDKLWSLKTAKKLSEYPVFKMAVLNDSYFILISNRATLIIVDRNLNYVDHLSLETDGDVNSIDYNSENRCLIAGDDSGHIYLYLIDLDIEDA